MLSFFKLQQAGWQLLFGKVFSPLPWSTVACDTINSEVRRQRKLRKDYEDEVTDRITLQDLFSLTHLESHLAQTKAENQQSTKTDTRKGAKGGSICACVVYTQMLGFFKNAILKQPYTGLEEMQFCCQTEFKNKVFLCYYGCHPVKEI